MKQYLVLLFILLPLSILYSQVTIHVPGDYSTIQAAINAANNGDLVLVADGTYYENINFKGKAITVASQFIQDENKSHITNTIIDGSQPSHPDTGSVVLFVSGEDTTSVLCGFTITDGTGTKAGTTKGGAGILVYYSGAKIMNNIVENNTIDEIFGAVGGGILVRNSNIIIKNNVIQNNTCNATGLAVGGGILIRENDYAFISNNKILNNSLSAGISATGGGIDCWGPITEVHIISNLIKGNTVQTNDLGGGGIDIYDCTHNTPVIKNNVIVDNYSSVYGGGVFVDLILDDSFKSRLTQPQNTTEYGDARADQSFVNNTIYNNSASVSGGGIHIADMTSNIMNCILWGNTAPSNPQIAGTVNVEYSDVEDGYTGTGNIDSLPLFVMGSEFYHLDSTSSCIDAGNPDPQYNDVEDPNSPGNAMWPALGILRNDMGHCGGPNSSWYENLRFFPLTVSIENGWNMTSIPGLHPVDQDVLTWWINKDPAASVFKYNGGYQIITTAAPGEGYWMKHSGTQTYNTGDEWPAGGIEIVSNDPISVLTGWNLIGGYENSVSTGALTTTPSGLIDGPVYEYSGGYNVATNLVPGYGYWIKLTGDGDINIPSGPLAKGSVEIVEYIKDDWGKITITDNAGRSYTLYAVKGEVDLNNYELPPAPPSGMFDIRYGSGRIAEDINSSIQSIDMTGIEYPIIVKVENMDIRLQDETGNQINENMKSGEEITISNTSINKLMVSGTGIGEIIPDVYSLKQNYPNPFNNSTIIKYSIQQGGLVTLKVYNLLGEEVARLVNDTKQTGHYEESFDATGLPSGIYFYRLQAGSFVETKKMILLK